MSRHQLLNEARNRKTVHAVIRADVYSEWREKGEMHFSWPAEIHRGGRAGLEGPWQPRAPRSGLR